MTRAAILVATLISILALTAPPARAQLTLCNRTSYILYGALSAIQSPRSVTQGWTRIAPGSCQLARKAPLTGETYLVYARSSIAHAGTPRAWGGNYPVCVKDGDFVLKQAVTQPYCTADGTFALPFAPLDNRGAANWTMRFDEQPAMTPTQAQLAGVQRLLQDNGYKVGGVQGHPDKSTGAALAAFRAKMHFGPQSNNDELFASLEREARKTMVPAGYIVCNDSADIALVALGQIADGKSVSRGWWTVQPKACARTITTSLANAPVFLLAQKKSGAALVGGAQKFCTMAAAFEIQGAGNCTARGYGENGFARTDPHGKSGMMVHIGPDGLKL